MNLDTSMNEIEKPQKRLLTDECFNLLRNAQAEISDKTGFVPSLRKIVNDLINEENVASVKKKFINQLEEMN